MTIANPKEVRLSKLSQAGRTEFLLTPDPERAKTLAQELALSDLRKLRFEGWLAPEGDKNWRLEARLGATVVQPCGITLKPVTTRIEEQVTRTYTPHAPSVTEPEAEVPDDDTLEALPEVLNLETLLAEALSLALPPFPRAEGAELGALQAAPPGVAPLGEAEIKPFAALQSLKDKMAGDDPESDG